jgi:hypothetical protein
MTGKKNKRPVNQIKKEMTSHLRMLAKHQIGPATVVLERGRWFRGVMSCLVEGVAEKDCTLMNLFSLCFTTSSSVV